MTFIICFGNVLTKINEMKKKCLENNFDSVQRNKDQTRSKCFEFVSKMF